MPFTNLFPFFQPIIDVASHQIIGYEALARTLDEHKTTVSAGAILSDLNYDMQQRIEWDRTIRRQALMQLKQSQYPYYLVLNISSAWIEYALKQKQLPTVQMIDELDIPRHRIIIDINDMSGDVQQLAKIVKAYKKKGLKVAIDDFGTGFSQLERVLAIRPDIIKIDMRLFKQAPKGGIASDVVQLLTQLSKRTGCRIFCEGVETDEEFLFGLTCGAQYFQGFLFSEAQASLQSPDFYQKHIDSLRKKFFYRSVEQQKNSLNHINKIKQLILTLKQILQDDFTLYDLSNWDFHSSGILRFYICNNEGFQTSPNFNCLDSHWTTDSSMVGYNWSWRPYFYPLIAQESTTSDNPTEPFIISEHYKDFASDSLCKTISTRLDMDRILLVDIKHDL
jgi:EAL domain-containing protein (putative c-di-GMP-specific phosphodiesterase class I)